MALSKPLLLALGAALAALAFPPPIGRGEKPPPEWPLEREPAVVEASADQAAKRSMTAGEDAPDEPRR